jgi:POT family proton-dependent oligopeptide transporter
MIASHHKDDRMTQNLKHPKALIPLTLCYALFMAAFGGILASLTLYQTNQLHMSNDLAFGVFSAAMALLWILPLPGGYLAGKLGYIHASRVGLIVCALGMACFCINSISAMYLGLALFVVGNALATPALWCMVDHCYAKDSPLREAGFTLFYLFFNLGAVIGIFGGGAVADAHGFALEFGLDTVCLVLALLLFQFSSHHITPHTGRSIAPQVSWSRKKLYAALTGSVTIGTPMSMLLFQNLTLNNILIIALTIIMVAILLRIAFQQPSKIARNRLIAFTALAVISIAFWTLYSLEPSFLSVFISTNVDTHFLGMNIPAASFFAFDGVFVILIGLVLSRLWFYLSIKGKNPSLSLKFAGSLMIIGIGFAFLAWMIALHNNVLMPARYVVIAYAIFSTAELLVSPLGISMVGSLAPEGQEGLMMGFWQLATGIGGVLSGYIAMAPNLPQNAVALTISNPLYFKTFLWVGLVSIGLGLLVLLCVNKLKRLMSEPPYAVPQV